MFACKSTFTKSTWIGRKKQDWLVAIISDMFSSNPCSEFHDACACHSNLQPYRGFCDGVRNTYSWGWTKTSDVLFSLWIKFSLCLISTNHITIPYFWIRTYMFSLRKSLSPCQSRQRPTVGVGRFCRSMFILLALLPIGGLVRLTSVFNSNLFWTRRRQSRGIFPYYW